MNEERTNDVEFAVVMENAAELATVLENAKVINDAIYDYSKLDLFVFTIYVSRANSQLFAKFLENRDIWYKIHQ